MDAGVKKGGVIVVGVDGSKPSLEALHWAAAQAHLTGATLDAVMVWRWPTSWGRTPTWPPGQEPEEETGKLLAQVVESVLGPHGSVDVHQVVVEGHTAPALIAAAERADLLVLGSRGHAGFGGMLLGSVSQHCVTNAGCPVVIVRHGPPEVQ